MPFITQTPISDQIVGIRQNQFVRMPASYSAYDQYGPRWDSLENHNKIINLKPSDAIGRIGIVPEYSAYDTYGKPWDTLANYNTNISIKPSDAILPRSGRIISNYSAYDIDASRKSLKLIGPSKTPITNQTDTINSVITKEDFSLYDTTGRIATTLINNNVSAPVTTGVSKSRFLRSLKYSELRQSNFIGLDSDSGRYDAFAYTGTLTGVENPREKYDTIYRNVALGGQLLQGGLAQANGLISTNLGLSVNTSDISKAINPQASYELLNYDQLYTTRGLGYQDFRNFKTSGLGRLDGTTSLALSGFKSKGSAKLVSLNAAAIASAQLMNNIGHKGHFRTNGTYNLFNQQTYFGMGIQDEPGVLRNDFTAGTEATKIIRNGELVTPNALKAFPFRGDKVTVRDYVKNDYTEIYNWRSSKWNSVSNNSTGFAKAVTAIKNFLGNQRNLTKDFIKFHFTGPNAHPGQGSQPDDLFVFRANINSLNDSFQPSWTPIETLGRADSNWIYTSFQRSLDLAFSVYATSRDELRPMWRKLNYLATYTMPTYNSGAPTYRGNFLRITIGDLFISQPVFITSLTYTLADQETTWEINIEEDENMKQVPQKIEVNMGLQFIGDQIPKKDMSAYNLHLESQYSPDGQYKQQNGNWLADAKYPETQDFINSILQGNSPVDIPTSGPGSDADIERGIEISQGLRAR